MKTEDRFSIINWMEIKTIGWKLLSLEARFRLIISKYLREWNLIIYHFIIWWKWASTYLTILYCKYL